VIKALKCGGIVEFVTQRVRQGHMLTKNIQLQAIQPPVNVPGAGTGDIGS
jgi:hypothetical protein